MKTKTTIKELFLKKNNGKKIVEMAIYDHPTARLAEEAEIDILVVGDSVGMNLLGFDDTISVTVDMIELFTAATRRGAPHSFVVSDLPFGSYFTAEDAYKNSCRLMRAGADGIKLEGGEEVAEIVRLLSDRGILVHGHIGLTPQSYKKFGGFKAQGREVTRALQLIKDAKILEEAGCMLLLLEAMPFELGKIITQRAKIPVIGVGAGPYCDGCAIVLNDLIELIHVAHPSRFSKKYVDVGNSILKAMKEFSAEVQNGMYPEKERWYIMSGQELEKVVSYLEESKKDE